MPGGYRYKRPRYAYGRKTYSNRKRYGSYRRYGRKTRYTRRYGRKSGMKTCYKCGCFGYHAKSCPMRNVLTGFGDYLDIYGRFHRMPDMNQDSYNNAYLSMMEAKRVANPLTRAQKLELEDPSIFDRFNRWWGNFGTSMSKMAPWMRAAGYSAGQAAKLVGSVTGVGGGGGGDGGNIVQSQPFAKAFGGLKNIMSSNQAQDRFAQNEQMIDRFPDQFIQAKHYDQFGRPLSSNQPRDFSASPMAVESKPPLFPPNPYASTAFPPTLPSSPLQSMRMDEPYDPSVRSIFRDRYGVQVPLLDTVTSVARASNVPRREKAAGVYKRSVNPRAVSYSDMHAGIPVPLSPRDQENLSILQEMENQQILPANQFYDDVVESPAIRKAKYGAPFVYSGRPVTLPSRLSVRIPAKISARPDYIVPDVGHPAKRARVAGDYGWALPAGVSNEDLVRNHEPDVYHMPKGRKFARPIRQAVNTTPLYYHGMPKWDAPPYFRPDSTTFGRYNKQIAYEARTKTGRYSAAAKARFSKSAAKDRRLEKLRDHYANRREHVRRSRPDYVD